MNNRFLLERARRDARGDPAGAPELLGGVVPPQHAARLPLPLEAIGSKPFSLPMRSWASFALQRLRRSAQASLQTVQESLLRDYFGSVEAEAALRLGVAQHHMRDLSFAGPTSSGR